MTDIYLYILMRNDLASMNAGKAVAQGAHAANQMTNRIQFPDTDAGEEDNTVHRNWLDEWMAATNKGFGTTIVLGCTERQMRGAIEVAEMIKLPCGITHDPTYPLKDGPVLHLIPLDTCAYIFGPKVWCQIATRGLDLMP